MAQYYLRGIVQNENGKNLANVKITLYSKGSYPFFTGSSGSFGIPTSLPVDTITLSLDGYEVLRKAVHTSSLQTFILKPLADNKIKVRNHLLSITRDRDLQRNSETVFNSSESYSALIENKFIKTNKYPETGFALNIDKASYSNIRRFLNMDSKVPPDAVRIEEMLNYFNFNHRNSADTNHHSFTCQTHISSNPWNKDHQLMFIRLQAPKLNLENIPPTNLIFLIDVSGSMDKENRLPLLKSAFKLLTENLRSKDTVAIVVYGGSVGILLQPTAGSDKEKIIDAIEKLNAEGETPGAAAIKTAYELAKRSFNPLANNRVILATDGDFNVGQKSDKELENLILEYRQTGIYLTCLGVGMGNYKDSKLETLAKKGNGNFAYIDDLKEAEKVLITEFTKTMYAVASDAFLSVKFDSSLVKEYKLIGFENKKDAAEDSDSQLEGGEVGSGHSLIAIFEIIPTEKNLKANKARADTIAEIRTSL